jgi:hypothetical protein
MLDLIIQALEISAINDAITVAIDITAIAVYKTATIVGEVSDETSKIVKFVRKYNKSHRIAGQDPLQFNKDKIRI